MPWPWIFYKQALVNYLEQQRAKFHKIQRLVHFLINSMVDYAVYITVSSVLSITPAADVIQFHSEWTGGL